MNRDLMERIDARAAEIARDWPAPTQEQVTIVRAAFAAGRREGGAR